MFPDSCPGWMSANSPVLPSAADRKYLLQPSQGTAVQLGAGKHVALPQPS